MKIAIVNETDISGGAARATFRLHNALLENNVDSHMYVNHKISDNSTITGADGVTEKIKIRLKLYLARYFSKYNSSSNPIHHSLACFNSKWPKLLNNSNCDLVHLNWINGEMMSVKDIGLIKKPLVWTLHDMWAFCGSEHISYDNRFQEGYTSLNNNSKIRGIDLDKWVWKRKKFFWKNPINIVTPSSHMAQCVKNSCLMKEWPVTVIPNAIDTEFWKPIDMRISRNILNLPNDCPLICFGAIGVNQYHKGFDILKSSLKLLKNEIKDLRLIVFGQSRPKNDIDLGFPIHYTGYLNDEISLRLIYSSVNVLVVPSRFESFGQTASEAQACGTPVVAFDFSGPKDIVCHKETGYLAKYCDDQDLAKGIKWTIDNQKKLKKKSRENAIRKFSYKRVSSDHKKLYSKILESK